MTTTPAPLMPATLFPDATTQRLIATITMPAQPTRVTRQRVAYLLRLHPATITAFALQMNAILLSAAYTHPFHATTTAPALRTAVMR